MALGATALSYLIFGDEAFGTKPKIPQFTPIDVGSTLERGAKENQAVLPEAEKLASAVNLFRRQEGQKALEYYTPGATDILKKGTEQIAAMLRGEIPEDVSQQVQTSAAARALAGGFGGTGAANALTARDLGRTSLSLIESGISSAEAWLAGAQQLAQPGGFFDVTSMMLTGPGRVQFAVEERNAQFQRDLLAAQVKAAPDPFASALTQAAIQEEGAVMELLGDILGSKGDQASGAAAGAAAAAAFCWVARSAFGPNNSQWRMFRLWMFKEAPLDFFCLYLRNGEALSRMVERSPKLQAIVRKAMLPAINRIRRAYGVT